MAVEYGGKEGGGVIVAFFLLTPKKHELSLLLS